MPGAAGEAVPLWTLSTPPFPDLLHRRPSEGATSQQWGENLLMLLRVLVYVLLK